MLKPEDIALLQSLRESSGGWPATREERERAACLAAAGYLKAWPIPKGATGHTGYTLTGEGRRALAHAAKP